MTITLNDIGKRFQRYKIFGNFNYTFQGGGRYALLGSNGSGKSTLLRVIAGIQTPSKGSVAYTDDAGQTIGSTSIFNHIGFCAPGMELVEELTLNEFLTFHFSFKPLLPGITIAGIIETIGLSQAASKPIGEYSSGMKQRVKLAQAIFADTPILLLDEPCTNLDQHGVNQYTAWINQFGSTRTIIVASNDPREYFFCDTTIVVEDYK